MSVGTGSKSEGGFWRLGDSNADIKPGAEIHYELRVRQNGEWKLKTTKCYQIPQPEMLPRRSIKRYTIFRDDFNGWHSNDYITEITAWGFGNKEFQVYVPDTSNLFARDGKMFIKPTFLVNNQHFSEDQLYHGHLDLNALYHKCTLSNDNGCFRTAGSDVLNPVMSGRIRTHAAIQYGRINVRAKVPKGDWLWPGNIQAADNGGINHGLNEVISTLHWGPDGGHNGFWHTRAEHRKSSGDWHEWHTYSLEWTENHIITSVDNQQILHVNTPQDGFWKLGGFTGNNIWASGSKNAPFDQPFQLILNVAVGGVFFPDDYHYSSAKPWQSGSSHPMRDFWERRNQWQGSWHGDDVAMQIDYVEMIQY